MSRWRHLPIGQVVGVWLTAVGAGCVAAFRLARRTRPQARRKTKRATARGSTRLTSHSRLVVWFMLGSQEDLLAVQDIEEEELDQHVGHGVEHVAYAVSVELKRGYGVEIPIDAAE